jgi:hypothetical protein
MRHLSKKDVNTLISAAIGSTLLVIFLSGTLNDVGVVQDADSMQTEEEHPQMHEAQLP